MKSPMWGAKWPMTKRKLWSRLPELLVCITDRESGGGGEQDDERRDSSSCEQRLVLAVVNDLEPLG